MHKLVIALLNLFILACATRYSVPDDYHQVLAREKKSITNSKTVILFLVDGLPLKTFKSSLNRGDLPHIKNHFLKLDPEVHQAYSAFPSLTFTNIAGLLTEKPVHLSKAYGNSLTDQGQLMRFENFLDRSKFADKLRGHSIFSRLNSSGEKTVSLDYGLGTEATVASDFTDLKAGVAAGLQDYLYLDQKRIDSLENLLQSTRPEQWPRFIFIHLIGIDFLSHQLGPGSDLVTRYLSLLDRRLAPVLQRIQKSDSATHKTISMLTADHGFAMAIKKRTSIEKLVSEIDPAALVFNEGRMAGVFTKMDYSKVAGQLIRNSSVEAVARIENNELIVQSRKQKVSIKLVDHVGCSPSSKAIAFGNAEAICPELLDTVSQNLFYPHFIPNLIYYFQAPNHPDIIVVPAKDVSFSVHDVGVHGGPTADEVDVPLLLRNAVLPKGFKTPAIWQLLQFL